MYAEIYQHLKAKYNVDNFEAIVEAIEKNFSDIFKLDVLESIAREGVEGSYAELFDSCMTKLAEITPLPFTTEEVVDELCKIFARKEVQELLLTKYTFVPATENGKSAQLGYLEKLVTGQLTAAEPLTYVDMLRSAAWFDSHGGKTSLYTVAHIKNLHNTDWRKNPVIFVNFNKDPKGTPKWGVVDLRNPVSPRVYCEAPLLEDEKLALDVALKIKLEPEAFTGGISAFSISTGYTALAWANEKVRRTCALTQHSDFYALVEEFVYIQSGSISLQRLEESSYYSDSYRAFYGANGRGNIYTLARACILGDLDLDAFQANDLCKALEVIAKTGADLSKHPQIDANARSFVLGLDAALRDMGILDESADNIVTLNIPKDIDIDRLKRAYAAHVDEYSVNPWWLENIKRNKNGSFYDQVDVATAMVLSVFRGRAKKQKLVITLPQEYQLNPQEQRLIISFMQTNAYVTELAITNGNRSLHQLHAQLLPSFARNRWLAANGYRPPMADNYWKQAARYWLLHLHEHPHVLEMKAEHDFFKRCVREMGLKGLDSVLNFLSDPEEQDLLARVYGMDRPSFYAGCQLEEMREYLERLINYLKVPENNFPFSELGISYQEGNEKLLTDLLGNINQLQRFEKITLTDFLAASARSRLAFINELIRKARDQSWIGLVEIPELEDKANTADSLCELRSMYALLNDVILRNRHQQAANKSLKNIESCSNFAENFGIGAANPAVKKDLDEVLEDPLNQMVDNAFSRLLGGASWPLKKGGVVQLQLQQQQQIEQNRQIQQEHQRVTLRTVEEALVGELVDYNNIDRLLTPFVAEFARENKVWERSATLQTGAESLLQGFFHTWVNANTSVLASHVIHQMTQEAARALFRKHRLLASGLNPDNLPKGFYTQRSKDGHLILCYNAELAYVNPPNPLTIDPDVLIPEATAWDGDFRQFNLDKYLKGPAALDDDDWLNIILFAQLQPEKDYSEDYTKFCQANPAVSSALQPQRDKAIRNWPVFIQLWQYKGAEGLTAFLARDESKLIMPEREIQRLLLQRQPEPLQRWSARIAMDKRFLCALGQVYHRFGDKGVRLLLTKLSQVNSALGDHFFDCFRQLVLSPSANFDCFMSERFFATMDKMMLSLRGLAGRNNLQAWQDIIVKHMQAVGWDNIDTLWIAFSHFIQELEQLGLALSGREFEDIRPENMLLCLDRILESLKQIADTDTQELFLMRLNDLDRTHGGVPYALKYDGFKYIDRELELKEFTAGTPTYAPDLKELYAWRGRDAILKMRRTLASQRQFSHEVYPYLSERLGKDTPAAKHLLMWLLHTQYPPTKMRDVVARITAMHSDFQASIAYHLHQVVYQSGNTELVVQFDAMQALIDLGIRLESLFSKYPQGTVLEALSLLHQSGRWSRDAVEKLLTLMGAGGNAPDYFHREGYKLAVLFGADDPASLRAFYTAIDGIRPIVQQELKLLITQLLSLDFTTSNLMALHAPENFVDLLAAIDAMKADPAHTNLHRITLIEKLTARDLRFRFSKNGEFRALRTKDLDGPAGLDAFVDHEDRLWKFMQEHIAVPNVGRAQEALQPIVRFLKRLQLNRTYLNEIEPLLASLEKTAAGKYWSSTYFYQLLRVLQPDNEQSSFPISLLKVMLPKESIGAKEMDSVEKDFPQLLIAPIKEILNNKVFDRNQQASLCQIALNEYDWQGIVGLLPEIMATLSLETNALSRNYVLDILAKSKNFNELETRFDHCRWLLQRTSGHGAVQSQWTKTAALWFKAISAPKSEMELFLSIKKKYEPNPEKLALILHIVGWSSLHTGLKETDAYVSELKKKTPKLVESLDKLDDASLLLLAKCYPQQPSPSADDILRLIKGKMTAGLSFAQRLDSFLRKPFPEARADFGMVASTRESDLKRMIKATQVSRGDNRASISAKNAAQLTIIFSYLKRLESGVEKLKGSDVAISQMSQEALAAAFRRLSGESVARPHDDLVRAQLWAVLFEVLGRTTRKYPHLAQQFALIANDLCIAAPSRVLQLATGEGKSHFVAMRAARHAGQGKTVDVCTAKRTLAERDLEDYQSFFSYLGLKTAYIHPKSTREAYMGSQIHYSTTGDLSLFLDEQSYAGHPIEIPKRDRVGLFDEFDFIRDDEGRKTQYNYARPTGRTPKQMTWFYQAVNEFYLRNHKDIVTSDAGKITKNRLLALAHALREAAGEHEEKQQFIKQMLRDPLQLVQWLQSAHEAHALVWGIGFTVVDQNIEVGDEYYPMREIIPLSSDNQKMVGSTFSAGVQQLLAVRLNSEARLKGQPQNFHIHPESHIISSQVAAQRMQELWGKWEGFSGTISPAQAAALYVEQQTEVLHVPTNQSDLRHWHKPKFYGSHDARLAAIAQQLRHCLLNKQSILFSCKNDKQVQELHELFRGLLSENDRQILEVEDQLQKLRSDRPSAEDEQRVIELQARLAELHALEAMAQEPSLLSREEFASMMFYTNEEHRTASEVLADKRTQEQWHGGKKQKAVCLVASGFGRGDNVDVEAVFLLSVNDLNDLLQKGGRTARNGEEGEVFQFYLPEELREEEAIFKQVLRAAHVDIDALDNILANVVGDSEEEKCFERVMLLREYIFNLQNEANQGYHSAIAKYSSWGMKYLGKIDEQGLREQLTIAFSYQLKRLEKQWIDVSSQQDTSTPDKIATIERAIREAALHFTARYIEDVGEVEGMEFRLPPQLVAPIQLVVRRSIKPGPVDHAIAVICDALMQFSDLALSDERVRRIPQLLEELATDDAALQQFAKQVTKFTSLQLFSDALDVAVAQVRSPSEAWTETHKTAELELSAEVFFAEVPSKLRVIFSEKISQFFPDIQTKIMEYLFTPSILSGEMRILKVLPVLDYLSTFSANDKKNWSAEYIAELDTLLHECSAEQLVLRLQNSPPMRLSHLQGTWGLVKRCDLPNTQAKVTLLQQLGRAVKAAPEHRMRMLTKFESWSNQMSPTEAHGFLMNFCQVMEQFEEGRDWDLFVSLVNKTHTWWSKETSGGYHASLVELWKQLAQCGNSLGMMSDIIRWGIAQEGKSWFQLLSKHLKLAPELEIRHRQQLEALWADFDSQTCKKEIKVQTFEQYVTALGWFYHSVFLGAPDVCAGAVQQLQSLSPDRFKQFLGLIVEKLELCSKHPQLLPELLAYFCDRRLLIQRAIALSQVLINAIAHTMTSPQSLDYLIGQLSATKEMLIGLSDDKFCKMMQLIHQNIEVWVKHRQLYSSILQKLAQPQATCEHAKLLSELLLLSASLSDENVTYLNLMMTRHWDAFINLPAEKFAWIMGVIQTRLEHWPEFPELLPELLAYLFDPNDVTLERMEAILKVFLRAMELQEEHPGSLDNLLELLKVYHDQLKDLDEEKFEWVISLIIDSMEQILRYPEVLPAILSNVCDKTLPFETTKILGKVVLQVANYKIASSNEMRMKYLLSEGVDSFREASIAELRILNEILDQYPENTVETLFDDTVPHLARQLVHWCEPMKEVIQLFYRVAKQHGGTVDAIFADPDISRLFAKVGDDQATRKQRVILMNLLQQHAVKTKAMERPGDDIHDYQWTEECNQQLLQLGFDWYLCQTKATLGIKPAVVNFNKIRDLTTQQQHALLQLSDDLLMIMQPQLAGIADSNAKVKTCGKELSRLMESYSASWFKSNKRNEQLVNLQGTVNQLLGHQGMTTRYESVLRAISQAKLAAIDSDMDQDRHRWFKMNRNGQSRYFSTLNQMQDMVLRHWVVDAPAIQSFHVYQQFSGEEFLALAQKLSMRVASHDAETYLAPHDPRNSQLSRRLGRFFHRTEDQTKLQSLNRALNQFNLRCNTANAMTAADARELIKEIHLDLPRLPGHLMTLAKEVLARGDALVQHLAEKEGLGLTL